MTRELRNRFAARKDVLAGFSSYRQGAAQEAMELLERTLAISP